MIKDAIYSAADAFLSRRLSVGTQMGTKAIAGALQAKLRQCAFFSAKVGEARIVTALRELSDAYSSGRIGRAEARSRLKEFLEQEPGAAELPRLAKTARLNLILDQNARMAAAVGRWQVAMDKDVMERFPYWRYIAGPNPRDSHKVLDGLILRKDDPFWASHFPPWEFNCNCDLEEVDEEEAAAAGGAAPRGPAMSEPKSGFEFNPADASDEKIEVDPDLPDDLRRKIEEAMRGAA